MWFDQERGIRMVGGERKESSGTSSRERERERKTHNRGRKKGAEKGAEGKLNTLTTLTFKFKLDTLEILESPIRPFLICIPDAPTVQRYASGHEPGAFQSAHSDRGGTAGFVWCKAHVCLWFLVSPGR